MPPWTPRPIFGEWTPDQARVASCFPGMRRVVVPAANGVGKTVLAADLVTSFLLDRPSATVILTAPTNRQVCELLWPHITRRLRRSGLVHLEFVFPMKPRWEGGDGDRIVGFATNSPERMQGFHAEDLLIVIDEASGMPRSITDALEGIANGSRNYILAIGNPNTSEGAFYAMTRLPSWHTETISALSHPNILTHDDLIPGATSWIALVDRLRDWCSRVPEPGGDSFTLEVSEVELQIGEDSERRPTHFVPNDMFRIRYLGEFPARSEWSLINRDDISRAIHAQIPGTIPRIAALDIARMGDDRTVYGVRAGDTVERIQVIPSSDFNTQARIVSDLVQSDAVSSLICDSAGLGIGLVDAMRGKGSTPIIPFCGGSEPIGVYAQETYFNRRSAAYGNLQQAFRNGRISIPEDPDLIEELSCIRYRHTDRAQLQVLRKEDIKNKLGRSPDLADMLSLLWESGTEYEPDSSAVVQRPAMERW